MRQHQFRLLSVAVMTFLTLAETGSLPRAMMKLSVEPLVITGRDLENFLMKGI